MRGDTDAGAQLWRCADGEMLLREWDDEAVVFAPATCTTHLLTADAAVLLRTLRDLAHEVEATSLWQAAFGSQADDNEQVMLIETLRRLAQVGLVSAVHP